MTFKDKPTLENVIFGHFNSRRLEFTYIFERGLVFKCHKLLSSFAFNFNLRHYTEDSESVIELGCGKEGVIFEVTDAVYGATLQQPKFKFVPADTTCEQKRIPRGDMCEVNPDQFKKFMEDKCVGRQSCAVTSADAVDAFGSG